MKVLVVGARGQVGNALMRAPWPSHITPVGTTRETLDVTKPEAIAASFASINPDLVINATAYTAVDKAEADADNAYATNAKGVEGLALACAARNAPLIHISTDYVFDGQKIGAYVETDAVNPVGVYGASKAAGEAVLRATHPAHVIVRTSWVYSDYGQNFVRTMLRLGADREDLGVVADQRGVPTAAFEIAEALIAIAEHIRNAKLANRAVPWGTYHLTAMGSTTWHGVAEHIFDDMQRRTGRRPRCREITTAEYPTPAARPANSQLDCSLIEKNFDIERNNWHDSLNRVLVSLAAQALPIPTKPADS